MDPVIKIEHPTVPQEAIDFANAIAELAQKYGVRECSVSYRMDWRDRSKPFAVKEVFTGHLTAHCMTVDGRGRPFRRVSVEVDAKTKVIIQHDPHSTS